jgi:hypothetical protein
MSNPTLYYPEHIRAFINKTLSRFIGRKLTQESIYSLKTQLINDFRSLREVGYIQDEIDPEQFNLYAHFGENAIIPANEYTGNLLTGKGIRVDNRMLPQEEAVPEVKKLTRYDIAKGTK